MIHMSWFDSYEDVRDICGDDGKCATLDYINNGSQEGLYGYTEGGSHDRWTVRYIEPQYNT